jgi:RNA polymerase sigma-70 factor, ECF subfamily
MIRAAKRRPESVVADLTEDENDWLDNRLAAVSTARHESSERGFVAADLAEKVLSQMSPDDRTVLLMIDGDEMPVKEVAEITGWSESKVKTQAFRARRRMREAVEALLNRRGKIRP